MVAVQAADGDSTAQIVYQGGSGSTEIWEIDVESPVVAETLVVVVDLHRRVLETKDKPVPAASLRVSKKSSKAGVTAAPPAVAAHNAEQEVDDGEVGAADPGDTSVDELSDSSSEEGGDDESDASFMALSETARDSLTLMINDPAKRESWEIPIQQLRITQVNSSLVHDMMHISEELCHDMNRFSEKENLVRYKKDCGTTLLASSLKLLLRL